MNAVIYLLVSLGAISLGIQNWLSFKDYKGTLSLVSLCFLIALGFGAFGIHLLVASSYIYILYPITACFIPAFLVSFLVHWLELPNSHSIRYLFSAATSIAIIYIVLKLTLYTSIKEATFAEYLASCWFTISCTYGAYVLWTLLKDSTEQHRQQRLQQLFALISVSAIFLVLEAFTRTQIPAMPISTIKEQVSILQGPIPPFGAVFTILLLYVLHLNVKLTRLISLQELFARIANKSIAAFALTALIGLSLLFSPLVISSWNFSQGYVSHTGFQIFLVSLLFLTIYPNVQKGIDFISNHLFNRQGSILDDVIVELEKDIFTKLEEHDLNQNILRKLHDAGRTEMICLYLWDHDRNLFTLNLQYGTGSPIQAIGSETLISVIEYGEILDKSKLKQQIRKGNEDLRPILVILEQMETELCIPLWSSEVVIGWLNCTADQYTGGFSTSEIRRLQSLVNKLSTALDTIRSVHKLKEQHRLASLGTMSAGLAHEIRNPLAGIKGAAQYLQDGAEAEEIPVFLQLIISEANRLNVVVEQFLNYSRPLQPKLEYTHINQTILESLDVVKASLPQNSMHWSCKLNPQLPYIKIDANLFKQVWINLLQNAAQACNMKGKVVIKTKLSKCTDPALIGQPAIEIQIQDNGSGIDAKAKANLFVPFFTTKEKGTGLGLAMTQRIVEVHQGELHVYSTVGEGATFVILLPILE